MSIPIMWEFYQDGKRKWHWRHYNYQGKVVEDSKIKFKLKVDCVKNAKKHGYENRAEGLDLEMGNYD